MDKIYNQAKDKNVAAVLVYCKGGSDTKAYVDAEYTVQYGTAALEDAFLKGAVIVTGTTKCKPVAFNIKNNVGKIGYIKPNGTTATSADIAELSAKADE